MHRDNRQGPSFDPKVGSHLLTLGPLCTAQLATHLAVVGVCPRVVALRMRRARQQLLRIRTHSVRVCHLK